MRQRQKDAQLLEGKIVPGVDERGLPAALRQTAL
jgi:hypothetical protein